MKRMPDIKKLMLSNTSKPRQTWRQQLAIMTAWAAKHNAREAQRQKALEMINGR